MHSDNHDPMASPDALAARHGPSNEPEFVPQILNIDDARIRSILGGEAFAKAVDVALRQAGIAGEAPRPQVVRLQDEAMQRVMGSRPFVASLGEALNTLYHSDPSRLRVGKLGDPIVDKVLASDEFYERMDELLGDEHKDAAKKPSP